MSEKEGKGPSETKIARLVHFTNSGGSNGMIGTESLGDTNSPGMTADRRVGEGNARGLGERKGRTAGKGGASTVGKIVVGSLGTVGGGVPL